MSAPETGVLFVLNVGAGDLTLHFDPRFPDEVKRAKKMVEDMLRDGYALVVREEDGTHSPVQEFDPETCTYIVADTDSRQPKEDMRKRRKSKRAARKRRRVPASKAHATAIAPSAGG